MDHMSITSISTRRRLIGLLAVPATRICAQQNQAAPAAAPPAIRPEPKRGPRQDPDLVASFVGLAHKDQNLDRVAEMVSRDSRLVYASWDWGGGDWETGLGGASHVGSRKMARFLLEKGARIDAYCAAMLGERDVIAALVAADAGVVKARGPHGYCLLYHAAISGDTKLAELLNPHIATRTRDFNQSLSAAVRDGHLAMTSWLLNNGVTDPNLPDALGKRPLAAALEKGFLEVAEELRKHGARDSD
jgi:ankyrin repeat protein